MCIGRENYNDGGWDGDCTYICLNVFFHDMLNNIMSNGDNPTNFHKTTSYSIHIFSSSHQVKSSSTIAHIFIVS